MKVLCCFFALFLLITFSSGQSTTGGSSGPTYVQLATYDTCSTTGQILKAQYYVVGQCFGNAPQVKFNIVNSSYVSTFDCASDAQVKDYQLNQCANGVKASLVYNEIISPFSEPAWVEYTVTNCYDTNPSVITLISPGCLPSLDAVGTPQWERRTCNGRERRTSTYMSSATCSGNPNYERIDGVECSENAIINCHSGTSATTGAVNPVSTIPQVTTGSVTTTSGSSTTGSGSPTTYVAKYQYESSSTNPCSGTVTGVSYFKLGECDYVTGIAYELYGTNQVRVRYCNDYVLATVTLNQCNFDFNTNYDVKYVLETEIKSPFGQPAEAIMTFPIGTTDCTNTAPIKAIFNSPACQSFGMSSITQCGQGYNSYFIFETQDCSGDVSFYVENIHICKAQDYIGCIYDF